MADEPEDRGQPAEADTSCDGLRPLADPAVAYPQFAAWARGTAPVPPSPADAALAFPDIPEPQLGRFFARLGDECPWVLTGDAPPDDEEAFARITAQMPEMHIEVHGPVCGNCQAAAALAGMRETLRCVLLPWLEDQEAPITARRLRRTLEDAFDEVEDQIDIATHG